MGLDIQPAIVSLFVDPLASLDRQARVYQLHEGRAWAKLGHLFVIDVAPGHVYQLFESGVGNHANQFIECLAGQVAVKTLSCESLQLGEGDSGQVRQGDLWVFSRADEPSRIVVMRCFQLTSTRINQAEVAVADRPADIQLRSLWEATKLAPEPGYEAVILEAGQIIPRHCHSKSSALVLMVSGEAWFAIEDGVSDGPRMIKAEPGSVIEIPAGYWHGIKAITDTSFRSPQIPGIALDYEFGGQYNYPP